jgi:hypothetical protein
MKFGRLQVVAELFALLVAFDGYAAGNSAACAFEQVGFSSSHRCFGAATKMPSSALYMNSVIAGALGGTILKEENAQRSSILIFYPSIILPLSRQGQNGIGPNRRGESPVSDILAIIFRMIFLPTLPHHSALHPR